ncbi:unnamed protein product [Microthlaspi erraticum]|uniref:Uncharacterized protein n=1 Tax=Microthlaspi erraticum TaxID=1685480 RepID=A0A6D2KSC3_9BRAS|nr:unnamed protein product [Microthlaspi erraticum]
MARDTKLHGVRNSASAMRSRRISSVIHDLPSWIRPVGGVRLGILITSGMPSSLAWPDGPASSSSSESVSSPESCSSPSLCHSLSLFPTLGFGGDSRRFLHLTFRPPSRPQQPSLHPPPPSSCDAPPHPLGWLHQEASPDERRIASDAQSKQSSHRRHPWRCPFPFCLWFILN